MYQYVPYSTMEECGTHAHALYGDCMGYGARNGFRLHLIIRCYDDAKAALE